MLEGGSALWLADGEPAPLPPGVGAVVQTSGSTGDAKPVVLSRDALRAAAASARELVGGLTWHLALDSRHVAGLMVLVRAAEAGTGVRIAGRDLADLCPTGEGDAISLVPTQLHRALNDPRARRALASMDAVLVGGARLNPDLRRRADEAGIHLIHTYGMSETCGGCVWDGKPLPRVRVDLVEDERAPEGQGRIALTGPMLFDGYLGHPAATREVLRNGWLLTGDHGRLVDGLLEVGGRLDEVVISGGVNVDLTVVRDAVAAVDPEAAVLAVDDEEWGARIVLFASHGSLAWWRDALAADLPRSALPRQFVTVAAVPRTPGGKPDRAVLLEWAGV